MQAEISRCLRALLKAGRVGMCDHPSKSILDIEAGARRVRFETDVPAWRELQKSSRDPRSTQKKTTDPPGRTIDPRRNRDC